MKRLEGVLGLLLLVLIIANTRIGVFLLSKLALCQTRTGATLVSICNSQKFPELHICIVVLLMVKPLLFLRIRSRSVRRARSC